MTVNITLSSSPAIKTDLGYVSSPIYNVLPRETVAIKDATEASAAFEDYARRVEATDVPAIVAVSQHPARGQRRLPSVTKWTHANGERLVNQDGAAAPADEHSALEAATDAALALAA